MEADYANQITTGSSGFFDLPTSLIHTTYMVPLLQLVSLNKRSAMLLDRLMYNLKEIMKKPPGKDGTSDKESSVNLTFHERMITAS